MTPTQRLRDFQTNLLTTQHDHLDLWLRTEELVERIRVIPFPARRRIAYTLARVVRASGHARPRDAAERKLAEMEEQRRCLRERMEKA